MMRAAMLVAAFVLVAAGCASAPGGTDVRYGRIVRIDPVSLQSDHQLGVGSVLGTVAANALGHPGATGGNRAVAEVLGALGGGYGNEALKDEYPARRPGEHLTVALNNGVAIGVSQLDAEGLRTGDCVRIDGSGETARVLRAACVGPAARAGAPATGTASQADTLRDELRERIRERMARGEPPAPPATPAAARLPGEAGIRYGRVVRADAVTIRTEHELGLEGVINGVSGAALGNPLPRGDGRAFADVANALGSLSASSADVIYATPQPGQLVTVRLDNGVTVVITQLQDETLRAGDTVRIEGAGPRARAVRA
ncbi:MAG TPA: hypothetical protein VML91_01195 [Burkholderiales bacterium]|nr:hypothetical protein [Burkholderiales bacterium]